MRSPRRRSGRRIKSAIGAGDSSGSVRIAIAVAIATRHRGTRYGKRESRRFSARNVGALVQPLRYSGRLARFALRYRGLPRIIRRDGQPFTHPFQAARRHQTVWAPIDGDRGPLGVGVWRTRAQLRHDRGNVFGRRFPCMACCDEFEAWRPRRRRYALNLWRSAGTAAPASPTRQAGSLPQVGASRGGPSFAPDGPRPSARSVQDQKQ